MRLPSAGLMPAAVRSRLAGELGAANAQREARARRQLAVAATPLKRAGWRVRTLVRSGAPVQELIDAAREADVLILGARGVGAVERVLLGSVAEGALSYSRGPVLVVR
jgi:nucleotide-binding universal stress UspA family protein